MFFIFYFYLKVISFMSEVLTFTKKKVAVITYGLVLPIGWDASSYIISHASIFFRARYLAEHNHYPIIWVIRVVYMHI